MRLLLLLLCLASCAGAVEHHGVVVPDQVGELPLRGTGLLRWKWVFRIYVGALYLPAGTAETAVLGTRPKRLEFTYQRAFSAADLRQATDQTIFRGVAEPEVARLKPFLATWNAGYPDVVAGDHLAIDHRADGDLVLSVNGVVRATVRDDGFAQAMFAIWLGAQAVDDDFKDRLLGR